MDGTGQYAAALASNVGLYYSTNYGQDWTISNIATWSGDGFVAMAVQGTAVVAVSAAIIYYSSTRGQTFTQLSGAPAGVTWKGVACDATCNRIIAVGAVGKVYASPDAGVTWTVVNNNDRQWAGPSMNFDGTRATVGDVSGGPIFFSSDTFVPYPTSAPTASPTALPTSQPSRQPSSLPSTQPNSQPTSQPSSQPSSLPSAQPSAQPSTEPTSSHYLQILASPTYKVQNGFAFVAIDANGMAHTWGEAPYGGDSSAVQGFLRTNIATVVASRFAFTAVKTNGTAAAWGVRPSITGLSANGINDDISIVPGSLVASEGSFAGIHSVTGGVVAFGSKYNGGDVNDDAYCSGHSAQLSSGVRSITASAGAFVALKSDSTLLCWGNKYAGADATTSVLATLSGARLVVATRAAFAVLLLSGHVVAWGDRLSGGDASAVTGQLAEVHHLTASLTCFVAFKKNTGVVVWGYGPHGCDTSAVAATLSDSVVHISFTRTAMAAVKSDGSVVAWGTAEGGGDSSAVQTDLHDVVRVFANGVAFAALTSAGAVVVWGDANGGGVIPGDKTAALANGVLSIYHSERAFAALRDDGSLVVWGQAGHGGNPGTTVEALLISGVHTVCSNDAAFSAIKTDGSVVAWGHAVSVPVPGVQFTASGFVTGAVCA
jgi:hypothetical protein